MACQSLRDTLDGILLVDKAMGETSHDVVRKVKRALRGLGVKKVGHAGSLDPISTGLLVILLGQGTKLSPYIMAERKRYLATVTLGVETDTMDAQGEVLKRCAVGSLTHAAIQGACRGFLGEIDQIPPAYSAVKVAGVPAYKLARKGLPVTLGKRVVTIYSLELLDVNLPDITMQIECSGGTYIRSLASDLGKATGTCGHLKALRRLGVGPFSADDAVVSNGIKVMGGNAKEKVIPLERALPRMRTCRVPEAVAFRIRRGGQPTLEELGMEPENSPMKPESVKVIGADRLVAIARVEWSGGGGQSKVKLERVFS